MSKRILETSEASGELALLQAIRSRTAKIFGSSGEFSRVRLGIGDDCALLRPRDGEEIAVTTDLSIEGRHFRLGWHPPESVGHRTLARGLSDLAAMGASPAAAFLSLGVPRELTVAALGERSWFDRFLDGLLALATEHRVPLAGGDLSESPLALADIVLTGVVPRGKALLRSGARPGDSIYVTGRLGGAAAELQALRKSPAAFAGRIGADKHSPHLYPAPRVKQGIWLREHSMATAAMDLSDGLSTDLAHLCQESDVSAEIVAADLPLGPGATLDTALHGGEDYELLFTARPDANIPRSIAGVRITRIGSMAKFSGDPPQVSLRTSSGSERLIPRGWEHFSDQPPAQ